MLTSLTDPAAFPATESWDLDQERWELELGYDEIKTEMLEREETIRCKGVASVEQELWGIFLAYNMVRLEMERTADQLGVEPVRISLAIVGALRLICEERWWISSPSPGALPKNLARLRSKIAKLVPPPRWSERSLPSGLEDQDEQLRPEPPGGPPLTDWHRPSGCVGRPNTRPTRPRRRVKRSGAQNGR